MQVPSAACARNGLWCLLILVTLQCRPAWAQVDLTGEWAPRKYNDHRDIGDYTGIPLNEAGKLRAASWEPNQVDLPENICRRHPPELGFRVGPSDLSIDKELDKTTRQIIAYHIHSYFSEETIWMDGRPRPSEYALHKQAGFSTGRWEGNTLVVTTTHLKEGYLTRAGVPRSSKATVTKRINRYGDFLTMVFIVEDPVYLEEPYVGSETWVNAPDQVVSPFACEPVAEGAILPAGKVPSYLPEKNDAIDEFATEFGIPPDAAKGGAETTYPEYIEKMKTMKKLPRTTTSHYQRQG
jgi:hypothetical protein